VLPPSYPDLKDAILAAAKLSGAGYVHREQGIAGWFVSGVIPRGVEAYFRVVAGRVYVRSADDRKEYLFGRIEGATIIQAAGPARGKQ